ncbi:hypothetical protein [Acidithiobacillus thiooxidans]|uniref:hypothetical protein n=1 Tax=Acidithiobacillus thiooxidans TaxID=930 RepID=UPI0004E0E7C5|nr:hypothetical protein [Acidithiobacillus thiooxidans]
MASIGPRYDRDKNLIGWQARVIRKGYPTSSKTFRQKKDAEQWARSIENEMDKGIWRDRSEAEHTTLKDALNRYAQEIIPTKKSGDREIGYLRQWQKRPLQSALWHPLRGRMWQCQ